MECINCGACVDARDQTMGRWGIRAGSSLHHRAQSWPWETQVARAQADWLAAAMLVMLGSSMQRHVHHAPWGSTSCRITKTSCSGKNEGLIENTTPEDPQQDPELPDLPAGRGRTAPNTSGSGPAR